MANKHTISQRKYDDAHCRYITLKLNLTTDKSVLAKLDSVPSRQGYIKELVLRDLGIEPKRKKEDIIYSKDDIVEDVTLPDDPGTPLDE